jgi:hypothetical protein
MTGNQLVKEFASQGHAVGPTVVFDEHVALALIRRAQEHSIAVAAVDQLRPEDFDGYQPLHGSWLGHGERLSSWRQATLFVESLSSRGLYFNFVLESAWATWFARFRWHMTHGPAG